MLLSALDEESYTIHELESELRLHGVRDIGEVEFAFLELGGSVSVFTYPAEKARRVRSIMPLPEHDAFMKV